MEDWEKETCIDTVSDHEIQLTPNCKVKYKKIAWMQDNEILKRNKGDTTKYGLEVLRMGIISGPFPDKEPWIIKLKPGLVETLVALIIGREDDLEKLKKNLKN